MISYRYRLRRLKEQYDLSTQEGKIAYARAASGIIADVDPVEREIHLKELSLATGFPRETLLEQMDLTAARQPAGRLSSFSTRTSSNQALPVMPLRT